MGNPIKILQVFGKMNRGGAETMIMNLYRNIDRSKIQFDFIVHTEEICDFDEEIRNLGGNIFRVPFYTGKNHLKYIKSWEYFFKNNPDYRLIHGHLRSTAALYLKIAKKYGILTIAHSHSTTSGSGFSGLVKSVLQIPIKYIADYLFACSDSAGKWLFGDKNFYIIKNSIDAKNFIYDDNIRKEKRVELNINENFVVGHIGRFHSAKNHELLIDIFNEVHAKEDNAILLLVGDGEKRALIEEKVCRLNLDDNVIFVGKRKDIPELLQAMDVFLFPSLYEGLGIAVIEAQAAGLPSVVADTIPDEAFVTNLIESVSLEDSVSEWSDRVLKYSKNYNRLNTFEKIKEEGYDIIETSKWLENFYLTNWKE